MLTKFSYKNVIKRFAFIANQHFISSHDIKTIIGNRVGNK